MTPVSIDVRIMRIAQATRYVTQPRASVVKLTGVKPTSIVLITGSVMTAGVSPAANSIWSVQVAERVISEQVAAKRDPHVTPSMIVMRDASVVEAFVLMPVLRADALALRCVTPIRVSATSLLFVWPMAIASTIEYASMESAKMPVQTMETVSVPECAQPMAAVRKGLCVSKMETAMARGCVKMPNAVMPAEQTQTALAARPASW